MVIPIRRQESMGNMGKIFYVSSKLDKPSKGKKTWGDRKAIRAVVSRLFRERKNEIQMPEVSKFLRHGNGISFPLEDSNYFIFPWPAGSSNRKAAESPQSRKGSPPWISWDA